eukprot:1157445-Pelagomonas_calceolata.AAC.4
MCGKDGYVSGRSDTIPGLCPEAEVFLIFSTPNAPQNVNGQTHAPSVPIEDGNYNTIGGQDHPSINAFQNVNGHAHALSVPPEDRK